MGEAGGRSGEGATRIGVDVGGTFTDAALESGGRRATGKVLTTPRAPEKGALAAIQATIAQAGFAPGDVDLILHGTTLATNALIERRGARTALVTTRGFRDVLELRAEDRYEQYDLDIELPAPLVPRRLRLPVTERVDAGGRVRVPLAEDEVDALLPVLEAAEVEAVAVGFLHSYANPDHEQRARDRLARSRPDLPITLSCEVSPEMREYERFTTACANAYVQPLMAGYLARLEAALREEGFGCPLLLMLSGGGLTTVETSRRFPVRLVESGPAGGAIFSASVAAALGLEAVLSFDMGGTTAKICLVDGGRPQAARRFEVARIYHSRKGSGLPLRIPVIEMVEIGAGGGSIAHRDALGSVAVGPESAGSTPGPACYGRGGARATVTDADLVLGRLDPARFSGGAIALDVAAARAALAAIGEMPGDAPAEASAAASDAVTMAYGVGEIVDENMANAARVHAVESGKDVGQRALIAFGGAAPLHVARLAEKLGVARFVVPPGAGVGSALGFLRAPVAYEVVRTHQQSLAAFDPARADALLRAMAAEARGVVEPASFGASLVERRLASLRYVGQGSEVTVEAPAGACDATTAGRLREAFEARYRALYAWLVPGATVELVGWSVTVATDPVVAMGSRRGDEPPPRPAPSAPRPTGTRDVYDSLRETFVPHALHWRPDLVPGAVIPGPAVIAEAETSTVVSARFVARIDAAGAIDCRRVEVDPEANEGTVPP